VNQIGSLNENGSTRLGSKLGEAEGGYTAVLSHRSGGKKRRTRSLADIAVASTWATIKTGSVFLEHRFGLAK